MIVLFRAGLTTLSLRQERSRHVGRRWNVSGSVVAAAEPFVLSQSGDAVTLWDRRDAAVVQEAFEEGRVLAALAVLEDARPGQDATVA